MTRAEKEWDETYRDGGYEYCRPCDDYHRPPECAITETGAPVEARSYAIGPDS